MTTYDNVVVSLVGNDSTSIVITDPTGRYSFNVPGGNYVLTPTKLGYTFDPGYLELNAVHSDTTGITFSATEDTYSINGTITGTEDVEVFLMGDATATIVTSGAYSFTDLLPGYYELTAIKLGFTSDPTTWFGTLVVEEGSWVGMDFYMAEDVVYTGADFSVTYTYHDDVTETLYSNDDLNISHPVNNGTPISLSLTFNCLRPIPEGATVVWSIGVDGSNGTGSGNECIINMPDPPVDDGGWWSGWSSEVVMTINQGENPIGSYSGLLYALSM